MKKAKLLIAVAAAAIGVTAVSAVAVSAADGKLGTVLHAARAEVEQLEETEMSMYTPGNAAYIALESNNEWLSANALAATSEFKIKFTSELYGETIIAWSDIATKVEGYDFTYYDKPWSQNRVSYDVYETIVPSYEGVVRWDTVQVGRMEPGTTNMYNQTPVQNFQPDYPLLNMAIVQIGDGDWNSATQIIMEYVQARDRLVIWAGTTGWWGTGEGANNVCDPDGNTDQVELAEKWDASALTYENLGYDVKAYFSNLDWTNPTEEHLVNNVANQYDFIIKKYVTLNNFAMRNSRA